MSSLLQVAVVHTLIDGPCSVVWPSDSPSTASCWGVCQVISQNLLSKQDGPTYSIWESSYVFDRSDGGDVLWEQDHGWFSPEPASILYDCNFPAIILPEESWISS